MARDRLGGTKTLKVGDFLDEFEKDDIKKHVDILKLFKHFGAKPEKKGKNWVARCIFGRHEDKTPSLFIDSEKGLYNCFGCGNAGDHFTLVMTMNECSFKEALQFLKEFAGKVDIQPVKTEKKKAPVKNSAEPVTKTTKIAMTSVNLDVVCDYYHKKLYKSKTGMNYLTKTRKIEPSLLKRFKLGYSNGSLLKIISNGQKEAFKALNILKTNEKGHTWEFFTDCITFPIFDEAGKVVHFYGRKADPAADNPHLYLSSHKSIFNRKASRVYDIIILCESILDCLSLITMGLENVQPLYGVKTLTEEHIQILKDERVKTIVLGFDNDAAGRSGTEKHKKTLLDSGFGIKVIAPPSGKDWNDCLIAGTKKSDIQKLINEAEESSPEKKDAQKTFTATKKGITYLFQIGDISYRLRGVPKLLVSSLRVNIKAVCGEKRHLDTVDICTVRGRKIYSRDAAEIFEMEEARIAEDLLSIVEWLEEEKKDEFKESDGKKELTPEEIKLGMSLLTDPDITDVIVDDMETIGYVGEESNKLLMYLMATSRKMDDPVSGLVISQSGSGKTRLVETAQKLIPEDEIMEITSVSDQAFNYVSEGGLLNKFLILGEAVHSEIVEHQIRDMLSSRKLNRLVTVKDKTTGEMVGKTIATRVVVAAAQTTTRHNINPENASRCFIINTDESREQTKRIHQKQNKKYTFERYREKKVTIPEIVKKHHAAQRLLVSRVIFNPYTDSLEFPDTVMRLRRDYERFLDLIAAVCFLRQYQKEEKQGLLTDTGEKFHYIECDLQDYRIAYDIIKHILPATLASLPAGAQSLYDEILAYARVKAKDQLIKPEDVKFRQREVSEARGLQPHFVKRYIRFLVSYEFITRVSGYRGGTYSYRLVKDEEIRLFDISMIPTPEEIRKKSGNRDKSPK